MSGVGPQGKLPSQGWCNLLFQLEGSVLPFAFKIATPCSALSVLLKWLEVKNVDDVGDLATGQSINPSAYGAFSGLLGFLIVFRCSQAYAGYIMGSSNLNQMTAFWVESASTYISMCSLSKESEDKKNRFKNEILRLHSLLSAVALTDLHANEEDLESLLKRQNEIEIIELSSFRDQALETFRKCANKVELVTQWINLVVMANVHSGVLRHVPAPLLARASLSLVTGLVDFQIASKTVTSAFPFPYEQVTLYLLLFHWILTPFIFSTLTMSLVMAGLFSFLVVFIFWGLFDIASELENPFGDDENDLDVVEAQKVVNKKLRMLLSMPGNLRSPKMERLADKELLQRMEDRQMVLSEVCDVDAPIQASCCAPFCAALCGCCRPSTPEGYAQARLLSTSRSDDASLGVMRQ